MTIDPAGVIELVPDQCGRCIRNHDRGRRDRAEHDPRIGADAVRIKRDVDGGADHCDVHLVTRDEPQIGVG